MCQIDAVSRPSWQAQISGRKKWTFSPVPECDGICAKEYEVIVEKGEISEYAVSNLSMFRHTACYIRSALFCDDTEKIILFSIWFR